MKYVGLFNNPELKIKLNEEFVTFKLKLDTEFKNTDGIRHKFSLVTHQNSTSNYEPIVEVSEIRICRYDKFTNSFTQVNPYWTVDVSIEEILNLIDYENR